MPIEQFLGPVTVDDRRGIRWVTMHPGADGVAVVEHAAHIVDDNGFRDLDDFSPLYDDDDRAWGWVVGTAPDGESALSWRPSSWALSAAGPRSA